MASEVAGVEELIKRLTGAVVLVLDAAAEEERVRALVALAATDRSRSTKAADADDVEVDLADQG